ncbi:unnamed protein product, partial [Ceratitis capitata]
LSTNQKTKLYKSLNMPVLLCGEIRGRVRTPHRGANQEKSIRVSLPNDVWTPGCVTNITIWSTSIVKPLVQSQLPGIL